MRLQITSRNDGFRRCGMAHSENPVVHEDGAFTPDQEKILMAEKMLIVQVLEGEKSPKLPKKEIPEKAKPNKKSAPKP